MKKTISLFLSIICVLSMGAQIRVVSNISLGKGYYPRFADEATLTFFAEESAAYDQVASGDELRVDNKDLTLNLYRNGVKTVLTPHGDDVNYVWASLSPDKQYILFNTMRGTAICDLRGREIVNLGQGLDAPVWYGNDYVVGMNDCSDSHRYTASSIVIASVDGKVRQTLTDPSEFGMYPAVDAASGRIAYNTLDGDIHMLQLNLTEEPVRHTLPALKRIPDSRARMRATARKRAAADAKPSDFRIYINPGHGGYTGDDRNMAIYPFASGDTLGFWESSSNLHKGLKLDTMLRTLGFQTKLSRVLNRQIDDRALSAIVAEANAWESDFMLSIHSNAGNPSNYILQLYAGIDLDDAQKTYPTPTPCSDESRAITTLLGNILYENEVTCWSREPVISGDKTFARKIMGWSNGYGVLRGLTVPGTISEGCMHDYIPETYRLMNMDYKWRESFYFARTFMEYFCHAELPYGAIGGQLRDNYQKQVSPDIHPRRGSRDELRPLNRATVELYQDGKLLQTYTTDTLYNGCYFFWNLQPGKYVVKGKMDGYYDYSDTLDVVNNKIVYSNMPMSMQRQTPPEVIAYTPKVELTDSVQVSTQITLSFNWDMREDSTAAAFSISPAVDGTITFEDGARSMRFTPATRFEPGVEYTVTLSTLACHPDANWPNHLKEPFTFKFRTLYRGHVNIVQTYPKAGDTDIPLQPSFITFFDANIVGAVASKNVAVLDTAGKAMKINSRSFSHNKASKQYGSSTFELVAALPRESDYRLVWYPDVKDVEGILLMDTVVIPFRTGKAVASDIPIVNVLDTVFFEGDLETSVGTATAYGFRNTNTKVNGQASNQIYYTFTEPSAEAVYTAMDPSLVIGNSNSRLGMQVFSDYSFNDLYARWAVAGDVQYTKICTLDYAGWKFCEADMSTLPAGVDYQFMGLRLVRTADSEKASGSFYVDDLSAKYVEPTGVEDIDAADATDKKVIKDGSLYILHNSKVYNANGALVR